MDVHNKGRRLALDAITPRFTPGFVAAGIRFDLMSRECVERHLRRAEAFMDDSPNSA